MSLFDGLKFLTSKSTKVVCPECKASTEQISAKVRKNRDAGLPEMWRTVSSKRPLERK
ncbi:YnfU family zinc-binding protein [Rouxiella chamberiensis]|uniref:YnfU family zinc-binding protein n=1 Tax=Rouxiella chamberiensis TaxID=1513468 RepID=UPI002ED46A32